MVLLLGLVCVLIVAGAPAQETAPCLLHEGDAVTGNEVVSAMRRGLWGCAADLGKFAASSGCPGLENKVTLESRTMTKKLSGLRSVLESARAPTQLIHPAFQWAQSGDSIFLNVKFAHKIDAPATLDVVIGNVALTNESLTLSATKDRKGFELALLFFGSIDPVRSSWTTASVGRVVFTLQKEGGKSAWSKLLAEGERKPQNMHLWWDKQEEFVDEVEDLEQEQEAQKKLTTTKATKAKQSTREAYRVNAKDDGDGTIAGSREPKVEVKMPNMQAKKHATGATSSIPTKSTAPAGSTASKSATKMLLGQLKSSFARDKAKTRVQTDAQVQLKALDASAQKQRREIDKDVQRQKKAITDAMDSSKAALEVEHTQKM